MAIPQSRWKIYKDDIVKFVNDLVCIPTPKGVIKVKLEGPWQYQADNIREATKKNKDGKNKYSVIVFCIPKQNGKTFQASLILLHKFFTQYNLKGIVASNSKDQASSVVFDTFKSMIKSSPELRRLVGNQNILDKEIRFPEFESSVTVLTSSKAAAWGYPIDVGIVDEIHAAPDDEGIFQILASQTGPRDGQVILPSQVSSQLNVLYRLYQVHQKKEDPRLYFLYIEGTNPSPLVTDDWLASRKAQLTPLQYALYHENSWMSSTRKLFAATDIGYAVEAGTSYRIPVTRSQLETWEANIGSKFVVGGGLDRALPYSSHGDRTFWTVLGKALSKGNEFYAILDEVLVEGSNAEVIKNSILNANKSYRLDNVVLEVYQASDIHEWALQQGIPCELVHAVDRQQIPSFTKLHQIVRDRQLAIPEGLPSERYGGHGKAGEKETGTVQPILVKEMRDFEHEIKANVPKFGHPPGSYYKDDSVYSLNWALYSVREKEAYGRRMVPRDDVLPPAKNRWVG